MERVKIYRFLQALICLCMTEITIGQTAPNDKPEAVLEKESEEYPFWNRVVLRHGGEMVEAKKYVLEVVTNPYSTEDKIMVYVTKRRKELDLTHATGQAELTYLDGKREVQTMHHKNNALAFDTLQATVPVNMTFNITIKKTLIMGIYYYPGIK